MIVVYETGGGDPEIVADGSSEIAYDNPSFQIRGRGEKLGMEALRAKMGAVYRALHSGDLGSDYVFCYAKNSGPMLIGLDKASRPGLTWNFNTMRRRDADI